MSREADTTRTSERNRRDPRIERSRRAIVDTVTELLSDSDVSSMSVDTITARSGVARSTLYRHFATIDEVIAAALQELLPPTPEAPGTGSLRQRLLTLVTEEARLLGRSPITMSVRTWLALAGDSADDDTGYREHLRERILAQYRQPLDTLLREGIREGELSPSLDLDVAIAELGGPLLFRILITATGPDTHLCASVVDDFLAAHGTDGGGG